LPSVFRSLSIRNYRSFIGGQLVSISGVWIQRVAQAWLVLDLTHGSGTSLGIASGLQFLPLVLFGVWGGAIADRYPKRRVLLITQTALGSLALAPGVLALTHVVQVWHVYVFAFGLGLVDAIDKPTRQAFVIELVGRERLGNAVGLNSVTFNVARMVGPAVGGLLVGQFGPGVAFLVTAGSFVGVIVALARLRTDELWVEMPDRQGRPRVREGLRYLVTRRDLLLIVGIIFLVSTFATNWQVMLALMARSVFHTGPNGFGTLLTVLAVGSMLGALLSAARHRPRMRYLVGGVLVLGVVEVVAGLSPGYALFVVMLFPMGVAALTINTSANTMTQLLVPSAMRGRVMSIYLLANTGGQPVGAPMLGWIAEHFGARSAFFLGGGAALLTGVGALLVLYRLRLTEPETVQASQPVAPHGA
jgi:MFS family permease